MPDLNHGAPHPNSTAWPLEFPPSSSRSAAVAVVLVTECYHCIQPIDRVAWGILAFVPPWTADSLSSLAGILDVQTQTARSVWKGVGKGLTVYVPGKETRRVAVGDDRWEWEVRPDGMISAVAWYGRDSSTHHDGIDSELLMRGPEDGGA